jgi:hypothetical protein
MFIFSTGLEKKFNNVIIFIFSPEMLALHLKMYKLNNPVTGPVVAQRGVEV